MPGMDENLLNDVVAAALAAGADAAEAVGAERRSQSITVRNGELEEVEREESRDLGLRVFIGQRQATVSGSDISAEARAKLVARAVAMAKLAPEDPYAGLADPALLARGPFADLDLFDPSEPSPEALEDQARALEAAARAVPKVINSDGGSASWSAGQWRIVTSGGFSGLHRASSFSLGASAVAGEGEGMETGYDGRSVRWQADLPDPTAIGTEAGRRAAGRLGARKIASTTAPVIFENRIAASLLGPLVGALSRSLTGWVADRWGGGRVTFWVFVVMALGAVGVVHFLGEKNFAGFFAMFLLLFFASGVGNASTFQMIPAIMRKDMERLMPGASADTRRMQSDKESAAIIGFTSAIAAYGAFFIPKSFGSSIALTGGASLALYGFLVFYLSCIAITWFFYTRRGGLLFDIERGRAPVTASSPSPAR